MPILSEETFLKSGQLFKKTFHSRNLDTCAASSTQRPNFRVFFFVFVFVFVLFLFAFFFLHQKSRDTTREI